jgi:hypothetical protein
VDSFFPELRFPIGGKEKRHNLFHFGNQLLYSLVSVTGVTTECDVNHTNAVNREGRKPNLQY